MEIFICHNQKKYGSIKYGGKDSNIIVEIQFSKLRNTRKHMYFKKIEFGRKRIVLVFWPAVQFWHITSTEMGLTCIKMKR